VIVLLERDIAAISEEIELYGRQWGERCRRSASDLQKLDEAEEFEFMI
jgi:hypothetical protein